MDEEVIKALDDIGKKIYSVDNVKSVSFFIIFKKLTEAFYNRERNNIDKFKEYKLHFGYLDSKEINACAFHVNNIDYVMVNTGCVLYIFDYYQKLLGKPNMMTNIGKPNSEEANPVFPPSITRNKIIFHNVAKDVHRQDYANFMGYISLKFLIYHELGHHYNGHMLYRNKLFEDNNINQIAMLQMANESNKDMKPLEYQAIEMDADAFASTQSIIDLIDMYNKKAFNDFSPGVYKYINSYEDLLNIWSYSIYSLFLLLEKDNTDINNISEMKYLPKFIRQIKNASILYKTLEATYPDILRKLNLNETGVEEIFINNAIKAENDFVKVKRLANRKDEMKKFLDKRVYKHLDIIDDTWEKLRPELEVFSRGILFTKDRENKN